MGIKEKQTNTEQCRNHMINFLQNLHRHRENFWAFTGPRIDFGLILLLSNMIIHRSYTGPTHVLSANVRGQVSFAESAST